MKTVERRKFIRHPFDFPVEYTPLTSGSREQSCLGKDLGVGGIAFFCQETLDEGTHLRLKIPLPELPFEADCVVVRTRSVDCQWEIGVAFTDQRTWFRVRMVEQVCRIEQYRLQQLEAGRELDFESAANEWIDAHGADFRRLYPD